ncbi:MAG: ParB/RepB/Spo0J family partition protein [Actinomycetota bacterium]
MRRRSGLGRGLDALLPSPAGEGFEQTTGATTVAVDAVEANPRQPRREMDEEGLQELATSIARLGVLQPVLVRERSDGRYELIAGERRLRAAGRAGLREVPAIVVATDDQGSLERALVENVHRKDLNPLEEAAAYRQLIDEGGLTHEALAERVGKNRVTITNLLRLLDLPLSVQELILEAKLTAAHGKILLRLEHNPLLERLARRAAHEGLSVRETEQLVARYEEMSQGAGASGRTERGRPPEAAEWQRRLADHLQTRVRIEMGKRKGKIVLDFVSLEELERVGRAIVAAETPPSAEGHPTSPEAGLRSSR